MPTGKYLGLSAGIGLFVVILLFPEPTGMTVAAKNAAAVVVLMSTWWISGAIPIYVTAFVPLALFPLLKILPAGETAQNYGHSYVLMLLAGFILAKAIESQNLHRRIACLLMTAFGTSRRIILLSIMVTVAFISMWISNVTTTVLMLPIALAIIAQEENRMDEGSKFPKALMFGVAYSATIGGVGTLIGSPTNLIFAGITEKLFPGAPPVNFYNWLKMGFPVMIIFLPLVWIYLVKYFHISGRLVQNANERKQALKNLGKMTTGEKGVLFIFLLAVFGWVFKDGFEFGNLIIPGWGKLFRLDSYIHDSTVAMVCAILLFILPDGKGKPLIDWKQASQIPWGVAMIVGGGFALAESFKTTGLAEWIGNQLYFINALPPLIVLILVLVFIMVFTEFNPNTATVNIFLPVLASMGIAAKTNPLLLMIPATIASSFAFMMPVGTGPNTVIFGSERISVADMAKCGLWLKLISLVLLVLILYFIVMPSLHMETSLPSWAEQ